jgi:integrase
MLFGEFVQKWAGIVKKQVEETTFELYRRLMNSYVLPYFGNRLIDTISSFEIELFISELECGNKFKKNILTPFRAVMKFAKTHKFIQQNPFDDVSPIKKEKGKEKNSLDLNEINKFIDALDDFWKPLFILLFFTGIRIEELSALKWKRVCFREGVMQIREVLVRVNGGKIVIKEPKTENSLRDVKLTGVVLDALREQRKQTWKGNGENFVFLNRAGRPIYHHSLNHRVFKPMLEKIGIYKDLSLKDTRASYITNSMDKNERMSFVQKQVGHTTSDMISNW